MGDPPNPAWAGEAWNPYRVMVLGREIAAFCAFGASSGGWPWHFMPPPHVENEQLHDHKDVDLFVYPYAFSSLVGLCIAVRAARELVARDEAVPGHASLVGVWGLTS